MNFAEYPHCRAQILEFVDGKLWNRRSKKYISVNAGVVIADPNDKRGASDWVLGCQLF